MHAVWRRSSRTDRLNGPGRFLPAVILLAWLPVTSAGSAEKTPRTVDPADSFAGGVPEDVADLKAMEEQVQKVIAKVRRATVGVSGASGVVVSEDGYILTVAHLGRRAGRDVAVTFPDGRKARGKTLGNDYGVDAGLVKITDEGPWPFAEMGRSGELERGQWCLALGYPVSFERGENPPVRIGRVLRRTSRTVVTDCPIMGGDSGGPLFDLQGKVVGVSSRCDDSLRLNLHVPVDTYRDSWDRLVAGQDFNSREPPTAFLGIVRDWDADGIRVGQVMAGLAAEEAGIKVGDVLVRLDGKPLTRYPDLLWLLRQKEPGDEVEIELLRGKETLNVTVTLGRRRGRRDFRSVRPHQAPRASQRSDPPDRRRRSEPIRSEDTRDAVKAAFREVIGPAAAATVRVLVDGKAAALGAIVDPEGYVVTKASLVKGNVTCRLSDGRETEASIVGVQEENDLMLLRIRAEHLTAVPWRAGAAPPAGSWVATVGQEDDPLAIGIVSVEPRRIGGARRSRDRRGVLGVSLLQVDAGPQIAGVVEQSAAEKAGLKVDDVVIWIDGREISNVRQMIETVGSHPPGESIALRVRRGREELRLSATLQEPPPGFWSRGEPEDQWGGGPFSKRRYGFPLALPHDTAIHPARCGGPLVDTDGLAVGINIARALRVISYAIPAGAVRKAVAQLKQKE